MPPRRSSIESFLDKDSASPVLDVRSPSEYRAGHIPGAISLPLFNDQERAIIGTLYKKEGRRAAIKKGLEIVGPKMTSFVDGAEKIGSPSFRLYCWRGGMRSESMAWLFETYGLQTMVLEGGYKAYRTAMLDFFSSALPLRVVTGFTGSKKTRLLHHMKNLGVQVVDFEALARHQGSSFGNQKAGNDQPTSEHFQNLLFEEFRLLDLNRPVFIEDESIRIGQVNLPDALFRQLNLNPHILIEADKPQRLDYLVEDYGTLTKKQLVEATAAIRKKLGEEKAREAIELINIGRLREAAELILTYYDDRYRTSLAKKAHLIRQSYPVDLTELEKAASVIAADFASWEHGDANLQQQVFPKKINQ